MPGAVGEKFPVASIRNYTPGCVVHRAGERARAAAARPARWRPYDVLMRTSRSTRPYREGSGDIREVAVHAGAPVKQQQVALAQFALRRHSVRMALFSPELTIGWKGSSISEPRGRAQ